MDEDQKFVVGDRVQRRRFPHTRGKVWSIERGVIVVRWDDCDENAYVRNPQELQRIIPRGR